MEHCIHVAREYVTIQTLHRGTFMYNVICVVRNISKWLHHDYILVNLKPNL